MSEKNPLACEIPQIPDKGYGPFGPSSAGTINRGVIFRPEPVAGHWPWLEGFTLIARRTTTALYDAAVAPEWWVGFVDPAEVGLGAPSPAGGVGWSAANGEFSLGVSGGPPASFRNPQLCELCFFELAGVDALVQASNFGKGWAWPRANPAKFWPLVMMAHEIGTASSVYFKPKIRYREVE